MVLLGMADLHGHLLQLPRDVTGDVAVIAGDIVPASMTFHAGTSDGILAQVAWIHDQFIPWLGTLPVSQVVLTWGNHDWCADQKGGSLIPDVWWPDNVHVLDNTAVTLDGITFYGVPQTPRFFDWAFNEDDTPESLGKRWDAVPVGTDVLVSHGPPRGSCDYVGGRSGRRVGSLTQERWLKGEAPNRPQVIVCGHIHSGGGVVSHCGSTVVYGCSVVNEAYHPVRYATRIEVEAR